MTQTATKPVTLAWSWTRLHEVAEEQGASFYVADLGRLEDNYRRLLAAFRRIYPNTSVGYSYKTNYLPAFILHAHALGAYSEVVSQFELDLARALGIPSERIIFNGPIKARGDLVAAVNAGVTVNVDSIHEARSIIEARHELPLRTRVGVRCWLGQDTPDSRFGIDLASPRGRELVADLGAASHLRIAGLHAHYSGNRSAEQFRRITRTLIRTHHDALDSRRLDYVDVGGGFASSMSPPLAAQLPAPPSTFEEYAQAIAAEMRSAYGADGPELILEPGMGLLADAMVLVTRVEVVKELGSRRLAVVAGSIFNIKPLRGSVNLPISVVSATQRSSPTWDGADEAVWDVVGSTCMEIDVLHEGHGGPIDIGDYIVVENVGAYTNVLNAPFIQGTPAIVALSDDHAVDVLRPRFQIGDLLDSYGYRPTTSHV